MYKVELGKGNWIILPCKVFFCFFVLFLFYFACSRPCGFPCALLCVHGEINSILGVGWSRTLEQAAQESGGITIPGNVQKACGCGIWGITWWDLIILELFSNLNDSMSPHFSCLCPAHQYSPFPTGQVAAWVGAQGTLRVTIPGVAGVGVTEICWFLGFSGTDGSILRSEPMVLRVPLSWHSTLDSECTGLVLLRLLSFILFLFI